jgi:hypothetical protein
VITYPKIETLWNRDERTHKVIPGALRLAEFGNINRWRVTEKIDGCNVRIVLSPDCTVIYTGRTDDAQMPIPLLTYLQQALPLTCLIDVFDVGQQVILFGEGYGGKIQKGGNYRPDPSFRLFDVLVGTWWLEPDAVQDVAAKLGLATVPVLGEINFLPQTVDALRAILLGGQSSVALVEGGNHAYQAEGIVARPVPLLLTRRGGRVMWKLKFQDF